MDNFRLMLDLDNEIVEEIEHLAMMENTSSEELVTDLIKKYLEERGSQ